MGRVQGSESSCLPSWVDTFCLTILLAGKVVAIAAAASIVETGTAAALAVEEEPWHTTPTRPHFFLLVARVDLSQGGGHPHSLHGVSWLPKHILVVRGEWRHLDHHTP